MRNFEKTENIKPSLKESLQQLGVDDYILEKYTDLISKIEFKNINTESAAGKIHLKMAAALFSRQAENNKTYLKNIIYQVELEEVDKIDISEYSTAKLEIKGEELGLENLEMEQIDLDIGTNRRVDKIECRLKNGKNIVFTLSADLRTTSAEESNSFQEKLVFESPIAEDNPILQKYYGYFEKEFKGNLSRFIAKEYLPGENISQYLNSLDVEEESLHEFLNIANDLGYSMAHLYNKGEGQLLSDLKLENIIYNNVNPDEVEYSCRVCDNSGAYQEKAEERSVSQILAHLQSLLSIFHNKKITAARLGQPEHNDFSQEELISAYLDAFSENLNPKTFKAFQDNIEKTSLDGSDDLFSVDQDLKDYVLSYLHERAKQ